MSFFILNRSPFFLRLDYVHNWRKKDIDSIERRNPIHTLKGPPDGNIVCKINEKSNILQDWCQIDVKNNVNHKLNKSRAFPAHIPYVFTMDAMTQFSLPLAVRWLDAKSMRNQTFYKIDIKLASKPSKTENLKVGQYFLLYFICFYSERNDTFLTSPWPYTA